MGGGDAVDRFLGLVDWGDVKKPQGWVEEGEFDDAEEDTTQDKYMGEAYG